MKRVVLVSGLLVATAATCTFKPHPPSGSMTCGSGSPSCPDGYTCRASHCWEDGTGPSYGDYCTSSYDCMGSLECCSWRCGSACSASGYGGASGAITTSGSAGGSSTPSTKETDCGGGCPTGMSCVQSRCQCIDAQATSCGSAGCAVLATDSQNCGACGIRCSGAQVCRAGYCECPTASQKLCSSSCVDLSSDSSNCGSCGIDCSKIFPNASARCALGACTFSACAAGYTDCNHDTSTTAGNGCETNTQSDKNNCGACGHACSASEYCDSGTCSPTVGCGASCASDQQCASGLCDTSSTGNRVCFAAECRSCYAQGQGCYFTYTSTTCRLESCGSGAAGSGGAGGSSGSGGKGDSGGAGGNGGSGGAGGAGSSGNSCTNPSYPVLCPATGSVPASCWSSGTVCSTVADCNGTYKACSSTNEHVDCNTKTCVRTCASDEFQDGLHSLCWKRCPTGQTWLNSTCNGVAWVGAAASGDHCPTGYQLPLTIWFESFIGGCDVNISAGNSGWCNKCSASSNCSTYYPGLQNGWYWMSDQDDDYQWAYNVETGRFTAVDSSSGTLGYYLCVK